MHNPLANDFGMAKRVQPRFKGQPRRFRRIFLREWRKYRGYTQDQLAEMVDMSVSNISQLERATQGYSQEGLERLAEALRCDPAHLLNVDPTRDEAIWSIWERASEGERRQIVEVSKALTKTGT